MQQLDQPDEGGGGEDPTAVVCLPDSYPTTVEASCLIEGSEYKERFGRYLLLERLGRGGMAEVFKAVAEGAQGFRRVFVVKRILPQFAASPYFVSLFADEAKLSALLHHPNLVQVYEFGAVAGIHYLSMEYLDGSDLATVLSRLRKRDERLAPSTAAYIAQQIAHGLAYAHAASDEAGDPLKLVHRDVSPENIMLLNAGTVKLFDFGIALSDQRLASSVTQGKVLKGKLGYTSPEQVTGRPLDGRSDIFSLGVVMWEMLTGKRLFAGEDDARTLYNVLERAITPPSQLAPGVPKAFDAVILRALARNPADRYPTADALAEDLDEVLRVVPHHRTHLPLLLERTFGAGSAAHQVTPETRTGAMPLMAHSLTAETVSDSQAIVVTTARSVQKPARPAAVASPEAPVANDEDLQLHVPTILAANPMVKTWSLAWGRGAGLLGAVAALATVAGLLLGARLLSTNERDTAAARIQSPANNTAAPTPATNAGNTAEESMASAMVVTPLQSQDASIEVVEVEMQPPTRAHPAPTEASRPRIGHKRRPRQLALTARGRLADPVAALPAPTPPPRRLPVIAPPPDELHVDPFAN